MKPLRQIPARDAVSIRVLTLRPLGSGHWELTDSRGKIGGYFIDMKTAFRFARLECGSAVVLVASA